ncbi:MULTISPECIES: nicotinate (nicotinamide) nucleotide adenylyltransferase [Trichocoleus]|uniref:Probable nicotinate-nucleotide adenylyltransferase n=1 Tax=Trichocoleus desertorum GB2-A4 TaxID=2933944 RepID=A0ABV0J2S2_9CYAN|nr:nicotinate (nicotinamide) nucleotide adenylyltransferase [Trichocoleus sp. FACHB-46]MBD1860683.1 nicotinate (nicotinamide) nucleotide adenylyltransferase [Trichocoleus sp. FACHB-46]
MQKVAILGGTFDPIHWGHLVMAEAALQQAALDQVIWVPTRLAPHKAQQLGLSFEHRLQMVQQAIADHPTFTVTQIEANRVGPSFAITTLQALQELHLQVQWYWIIGLDAFRTLPRWYDHAKLAATCEWLVAPRSQPSNSCSPDSCGSANDLTTPTTELGWTTEMIASCEQVIAVMAQQSIAIRWQRLPMPVMGISSSLIRQYCREQRSIRYLVPEAVRAYITGYQLYQNHD